MIYELENNELKISVSDLGATLIRFIDKRSNEDLVLGFDSEEQYLKDKYYMGASVGRNANRIGNAEFKLNGKTYKLTVNDNMNQLHGGIDNFAFKVWDVKEKKEDEIVFVLHSKDMEEGFPGNMVVEVSYKLENNNLIWKYSGKSDQDTLFNMTNHSYFNLGDENILNHKLKVHTNKYSSLDQYSLSLEKSIDVKDTPYDFRELKLINDNLSKLNNGIDNNYVYENLNDKLMAELVYNNIQLNVYSDLPDMHLYTSSSLGTCTGKKGVTYKKFSGICLECQYYPNSINYESYIKPILKKDDTVSHYIRYEIINK